MKWIHNNSNFSICRILCACLFSYVPTTWTAIRCISHASVLQIFFYPPLVNNLIVGRQGENEGCAHCLMCLLIKHRVCLEMEIWNNLITLKMCWTRRDWFIDLLVPAAAHVVSSIIQNCNLVVVVSINMLFSCWAIYAYGGIVTSHLFISTYMEKR